MLHLPTAERRVDACIAQFGLAMPAGLETLSEMERQRLMAWERLRTTKPIRMVDPRGFEPLTF